LTAIFSVADSDLHTHTHTDTVQSPAAEQAHTDGNPWRSVSSHGYNAAVINDMNVITWPLDGQLDCMAIN